MDLQLWAASKLARVDFAIRKKIVFYAPLIDSLDFMGIEPVTYTRVTSWARLGRDGLLHTIGPHVPKFDWDGELALGTVLTTGVTLTFAPANQLSNGNTLVWFEEKVPKATPTNANPFSSAGIWTGNLDIHVCHIAKADSILTTAEIAALQTGLTESLPIVPTPPPAPPTPVSPGVFFRENPSGVRNGSNVTFTLTQVPNPNSLILNCFGVVCELVASAPGNMQYTLSGSTITMGMAPLAAGPPFVAYFVT